MDDRNETAHPNGNIFFSTQGALDIKIREILRVVEEIQSHSRPIIERCYRDFLLRSHDLDEREYPDAADQIREILIHGNYLSQQDLSICRDFHVESLAGEAGYDGVQSLHDALAAEYVSEDAPRAA